LSAIASILKLLEKCSKFRKETTGSAQNINQLPKV